MEFLVGTALGWAKANLVSIGVASALGVVLKFVLGKYVPKEMVQGKFDEILEGWKESFQGWLDGYAPEQKKFGRFWGKALTDWGTKLPVVGTLWNLIVEPYIIIIFEGFGRLLMFLGEAIVMSLKSLLKYVLIEGFQVGALSDNPTLSGETKKDRQEFRHVKTK